MVLPAFKVDSEIYERYLGFIYLTPQLISVATVLLIYYGFKYEASSAMSMWWQAV